jgi:hypothetical protein
VAIAESLRTALRALLEAAGGPEMRESAVIARLPVERSLAGRLIRAVRSADPYVMLSELPAAQSLDTAIRSAMRCGEPGLARAAADARQPVHAYAALLKTWPGGRRGLTALAASLNPDHRDRADLASRRAAFHHTADLLGYHVDTASATMFVLPSAVPGRCDTVHVFARYGLRRTRPSGPPISVFALHAGSQSAGSPRPLPPAPANSANPWSFLCTEFCRGPARVELARDPAFPGRLEVRLPSDQPGIHRPVTIVSAQALPAAYRRFRTPTLGYEWMEAVPRLPARAAVVEAIVHADLFPDWSPLVTGRLFTSSNPTPPPRAGSGQIPDEVRLGARVEWLSSPASELSGGPGHADLVRSVADRIGLDLSRCRALRATVPFPLLMASVLVWFPLPAAPD